jgi:hypothetical protein
MRILKNIFRIISRNNLRIFHKIKCGFPYGISAFLLQKKIDLFPENIMEDSLASIG